MLNENKIKMMTKMAIYEKNEGRHMIKNSHYYKSDYVAFEVLKTLISTTFAYIIMVALYFFCNMDSIVKKVSAASFGEIVALLAAGYIIILGIYIVISILFYTQQYNRSRKGLKKYFARLNKLERFYSSQKNNRNGSSM